MEPKRIRIHEKEVEDILGNPIGGWVLPREIWTIILEEQLTNVGAFEDVRTSIVSAVSKNIQAAVDYFLKTKSQLTLFGEELRTEARWRLFASPRWKLITSLPWPVVKDILNIAFNQKARSWKWQGDTSFFRKIFLINYVDPIRGHTWTFLEAFAIDLERTSVNTITVGAFDVNRYRSTNIILRKNDTGYISASSRSSPSTEMEISMIFFYSVGIPENFDLYSHTFLGKFIWKHVKGYDHYFRKTYTLEETMKRVMIVRIDNMVDGTDIDSEVESDHWLRKHPWHYSFSSYIHQGTLNTGLLIIPTLIFREFMIIDLSLGRERLLRLKFKTTTFHIDISDRVIELEIMSSAILSHQPYDIIFLGDDMDTRDAEGIGLVQKGMEERAKERLITW